MRRLPFIDGVRGVAAFIVLAGHAIFIVPTMSQPTLADAGLGQLLIWPFRFGAEMVPLFLMVSGFSLHYSERARRQRGYRASTYRDFALRRAWRIAPVYYVAVGFGLLVTPLLGDLVLRPADRLALHLDWQGVVSHLFFVHNFTGHTSTQVNGPLWSIAYEVQLYLLFPLLYFAAHRWNPFLVCGAVAALDVGIVIKGGLGFPLFGLARWFVLGILLAEICARGWRAPIWACLTVGFTALLLGTAQFPSVGLHITKHDPIWAVAFSGLILAMVNAPESRRNPMAWRPMRWLGLRSYSLYALHWPLIMLLILASERAHLTGASAAAFVALIGVPASMVLAMISYRWVEGPSLVRVAAVGRSQPSVHAIGQGAAVRD